MREFIPEVMKKGHFPKEDFQINELKFLKRKNNYKQEGEILK